MKAVLSIFLLATALTGSAFDSVAWAEKRQALAVEVERLRVAYSNCLVNVTQPADDVTVPLETYDDGAVKTVVYARKAQYYADSGLVWAEGVVIKKFKQEGELDTRIDAHRCIVDRNTKNGWTEGMARITHHKTTMFGQGVYFSSPDAYVKVYDQSHVVSKDLKFGGLRP